LRIQRECLVSNSAGLSNRFAPAEPSWCVECIPEGPG
jgi:hypothetical protein